MKNTADSFNQSYIHKYKRNNLYLFKMAKLFIIFIVIFFPMIRSRLLFLD